MSATAPREKAFLLARPEAAVLQWLARRVPARLVPDHFTVLALVAAGGIAGAFALSGSHPWLLWAAAGLLVVHWVGDSLDGTLARVRRIERPRSRRPPSRSPPPPPPRVPAGGSGSRAAPRSPARGS